MCVDVEKSVWIFEISSNVEADSTEQVDGVRTMNRYGMNLLPGISVLLSGGHMCPVISGIPVASGLAAVFTEVYKIVYVCAKSYTHAYVYK